MDQQRPLRTQQILAFETDRVQYGDLFDGSHVVEGRTRELDEEAREELDRVLAMGGAVAAVENAYMKQKLVESHTARLRAIESGEMTVVGVNEYRETVESPLVKEGSGSILKVDESAEREQIQSLEAFHIDCDAENAQNALVKQTRYAISGPKTQGERRELQRPDKAAPADKRQQPEEGYHAPSGAPAGSTPVFSRRRR